MQKKFDHTSIEKKWQEQWKKDHTYKTDDSSDRPKAYVLDMFPYPSGEGLHVGHPKGYIATDVYSRFKKMSGFEVLHPMGWDAFGLPAENYAIKNKVHPRAAVEKNIASFKAQLDQLGFNYDWSREINTTDPEYYKWTQWIFLKLLEKGLAYESYEPINWCPSCQTGLANEDLESDGTCERCGSVVEKRPMRQWVLKITEYADRMLADLDSLAWPEHIKNLQRNWIGRSVGAEITFPLSTGDAVTVFTTRPDTLYGATYMVLAPEHPLLATIKDSISNWDEVQAHQKETAKKKDIERIAEGKEKTGIKLEGITATNPASKEQIPVYIADYVLAHYGTGAIMAVPAHDERDFEFACKYQLPILQTILPEFTDPVNPHKAGAPTAEREMVAVILLNEKNEVAVLDWHGAEWGERKPTTLLLGGIDDGETPIAAAIREVREEVGYIDVEHVTTLPFKIRSLYHASHKKENRIGNYSCVVLRLVTAKVVDVDVTELQKHTHRFIHRDIAQEVVVADSGRFIEWYFSPTPFLGSGMLTNSAQFNSLSSEEAKKKITEYVGGKEKKTYKLRDWVFSRQRYWGEPIPVIHCEKCGVVPVSYDQLPVTLPDVEQYAPTGTGESPLAAIEAWVNAPCPTCGGAGKRETNTMPQWAGSSWYYLRFIDPQNTKALIDPEKEKKWAPVDVYVGGDHAVRHLIYARFWHKFLYDIGVVSTIEPFARLEFLGFILAEDGRKMSKRWGNIINPTHIVEKNGADTLRVYEMFMGPFENTIAWSTEGLVGAQRFLDRINGLADHITETEKKEMTILLHETIKKVSSDIELFKFNTAISALMIFLNSAEKDGLSASSHKTFLKLIAPFAPHLAEELWEALGEKASIHLATFPVSDSTILANKEVTIAVQFNGKTRGVITVPSGSDEKTVREAVNMDPNLVLYIEKSREGKVIFVQDKIVNFVGKPS